MVAEQFVGKLACLILRVCLLLGNLARESWLLESLPTDLIASNFGFSLVFPCLVKVSLQ